METIQDLIAFFEAIPSERWTKNTLSSWADGEKAELEQNCAFGHLNKHLTGHWNYNIAGIGARADSWTLVEKMGIEPRALVSANNYGQSDAKTNVIKFLKNSIKEN